MNINILTIKLFDKNKLPQNAIIIKTKILLQEIENKLCKILDKYSETAKYYINIIENSWSVSFNVDLSQYEAMCKTMFTIELYKENEYSVLYLSKEITEHEQWQELYNYIMKKLVV